MPDPSTLRRWDAQLFLLAFLMTHKLWQTMQWNILRPPTILAWDWNAIRRILPMEANTS